MIKMMKRATLSVLSIGLLTLGLVVGLLFAFSFVIAAAGHDIGFVNFTNAVNNIKIETANGSIVLGETLQCNEKYKIIIKIKNFGNFIENVTFNGSIGNVLFNHLSTEDLEPEETTSEKSRTVNVSLEKGEYNIKVEAKISGDNNSVNNVVIRPVEIICGNDGENCTGGICPPISCDICKTNYKVDKAECKILAKERANDCKESSSEELKECAKLDKEESKICKKRVKTEAKQCKKDAKTESKECSLNAKEVQTNCLQICIKD